MRIQWWAEPVRVALGNSTAIIVDSNQRAAEMLLYEWPHEAGERHARASSTLLRSMERPGDPGTLYAARQAFVAAAEEAQILLPEMPDTAAPAGTGTRHWRRRKR